jgi:hypothetical protein
LRISSVEILWKDGLNDLGGIGGGLI